MRAKVETAEISGSAGGGVCARHETDHCLGEIAAIPITLVIQSLFAPAILA